MKDLFSRRTPGNTAPNRLTRALAARGRPYIDLTATNPTTAGIEFPRERGLRELAGEGVAEGIATYEPDAKGLLPAREAVAAYYRERGAPADPERIVLTASSSEAYAWLFKLLADPGDAVLVPAPSYPLLDALAELESVEVYRYRLTPADGWGFHASEVEAEIERLSRAGKRVAAVVVVNPNNPTGTSLALGELRRLLALGLSRGFAVISDEVFLDYRFREGDGDVRVAAEHSGGLTFSLGGLSKAAALPQLKLGWILANGPEPLLSEALARLEWVADTFLSVATPVQLALPALLRAANSSAAAVRERLETNRALLAARFPPGGAVSVLPHAGGWSAVLRVPAVRSEEELVLRLLDEGGVLVHPGYFYEFPFEAFLVLSLLPRPGEFRDGIERIAAILAS